MEADSEAKDVVPPSGMARPSCCLPSAHGAAGLLHHALVVRDSSQVSAHFLPPPGLLCPQYCPCAPSALEQELKADSNRR